jgi:hypothetical protein
MHEAAGGQPQQWHILAAVDGMTAEAIVFAVARGWGLVEAGQSICLIDAGRLSGESALATNAESETGTRAL